MTKHIIWALLVIAAALIQTTWLEAIRIAGVLPDLAVLLVVYFAILEGEERAMYTGLLAGLFYDVIRHATLGHHILCLVVAGYTIGRIATRLITEHPAVKAGLVFAAAFINGLLYTAIEYVQTPQIGAINTITAHVAPTAFYTAAVTPLVFHALDWSLRKVPAYQDSLKGTP